MDYFGLVNVTLPLFPSISLSIYLSISLSKQTGSRVREQMGVGLVEWRMPLPPDFHWSCCLQHPRQASHSHPNPDIHNSSVSFQVGRIYEGTPHLIDRRIVKILCT